MKTKLTFNDSIDPDSPLGIALSNEAAGSMAGRLPTPAGSVRQTAKLKELLEQIKWAAGFLSEEDSKSLLKEECMMLSQYHADLLTANARLRAALTSISENCRLAGRVPDKGELLAEIDRMANEALSGDPRP